MGGKPRIATQPAILKVTIHKTPPVERALGSQIAKRGDLPSANEVSSQRHGGPTLQTIYFARS